MARKTNPTFPGRQKAVQSAAERSWAAVGVDTSMTACSAVALGFDAILDKMVEPVFKEIRWMPEDDYFKRLGEASKGHHLVSDVLHRLMVPLDRVFIAIEEPFPMGMLSKLGKGQSGWIKQQCEVAGAFKGSLAKWGFQNMYEINNSQWKATLRHEGVTLRKMPEGKWDVKEWAIKAFGLPELPDLVKSKTGGKIPRPESGYGANAKALQPNDIYDAAACAAWMVDEMEKLGIIN